MVYPCYCSRADILATQAPHESDGRVVYKGTCRNLPRGARQGAAALRMMVPPEGEGVVTFTDGHYGQQSVDLATQCGDFIVRRRDGAWAYQLAVVADDALMGALMHVIFHSLVKNTLFVSAGAIICKTGKTKVRQLVGIGKEMPVTMWCFTLVSLTLIGIPPTSAFVSKWYLISGALDSGIPGLSWVGPVVLLISALLTAGYLLTISIKAFFPGEDYDYTKLVNHEPTWRMLLPMVVMTALAVILGIWPSGLMKIFADIAASVL